MTLDTVKTIFFWFAVSLMGCLIAFQIYKRDQIGLDAIPVIAKEAPNFKLDGVSLSDFRGKPLLLHFWATWCGPCREEMPLLQSLAVRLAGQVNILTVAVDSPAKEIERFFNSRKPPFSVLIDVQSKVANAYGISQFPETLLIDAEGRVQALYIGPQNWALFKPESL